MNTPNHTKKHMSTYKIAFVVVRRLIVIIACKLVFMHHVACRQVPFHGIGRKVVKDYAKIFTSNHVSLVGMKTCKLVELVAWDV